MNSGRACFDEVSRTISLLQLEFILVMALVKLKFLLNACWEMFQSHWNRNTLEISVTSVTFQELSNHFRVKLT